MRVGLRGTTRRRWGRRGTKIVQELQLSYQWSYLFLVVDGRTGTLDWCWLDSMAAIEMRAAVRGLQDLGYDGLIWDGAGSHRDASVTDLGLPLITLPPYSPELNPAERVFRELRPKIEGRVYPSLQAKIAEVESILREWEADPASIRSLAGWTWIGQAVPDSLPLPSEFAA